MADDILIQDSQETRQKQSGFGIASFVIAIAQGLLTGLIIIIAGFLAANGSDDENETGYLIVGLAMFGGIFMHLVGLGLGIAGAVQSNRKKVFAILGLICNLMALLTVGLLMIVGLAVG